MMDAWMGEVVVDWWRRRSTSSRSRRGGLPVERDVRGQGPGLGFLFFYGFVARTVDQAG